MQKLIAAYRKNPAPSVRAKIVAYMQRHPMAVCLLAPDDVVFLTVHGFL